MPNHSARQAVAASLVIFACAGSPVMAQVDEGWSAVFPAGPSNTLADVAIDAEPSFADNQGYFITGTKTLINPTSKRVIVAGYEYGGDGAGGPSLRGSFTWPGGDYPDGVYEAKAMSNPEYGPGAADRPKEVAIYVACDVPGFSGTRDIRVLGFAPTTVTLEWVSPQYTNNNSNQNDYAVDVVVKPFKNVLDSEVFVAATSHTSSGNSQIAVIKFLNDQPGVTQWRSTNTGLASACAIAMADPTGSGAAEPNRTVVVVAGTMPHSTQGFNYYVMCLNASDLTPYNGWTPKMYHNNDDRGVALTVHDIKSTNNGNFDPAIYLTGWSTAAAGGGGLNSLSLPPYEYATVKWGFDGVQKWVMRESRETTGPDYAKSITVVPYKNGTTWERLVWVTGEKQRASGPSFDYGTVLYKDNGTSATRPWGTPISHWPNNGSTTDDRASSVMVPTDIETYTINNPFYLSPFYGPFATVDGSNYLTGRTTQVGNGDYGTMRLIRLDGSIFVHNGQPPSKQWPKFKGGTAGQGDTARIVVGGRVNIFGVFKNVSIVAGTAQETGTSTDLRTVSYQEP